MTQGLKKYQSHKIVEAALIDEVDIPRNRVRCGDLWYAVPENFFARGIPNVGDAYFVCYDGGKYYSWSPKVVFEEGYTAMEAQNAPTPSSTS